MRGEKISLLCRPTLEKRVNQSPDEGQQDHESCLMQQQLLIVKWDRGTQVSQHSAAWDVGDFIASFFLPQTFSAEKECGEIRGNRRR